MERTITTVGTGTAEVPPDAVRLDVAVVGRGDSMPAALAWVASGVALLLERSRRVTRPERVRSTGLRVWRDEMRGDFEVRHSLSLACPDLEATGDLITDLAAELNERLSVDGIAPFLRDPTPLVLLARKRAWDDARSRAEHLAELGGLGLGGAITVVEGGWAAPGPLAREMAVSADLAPTRLEGGLSEVTASVTVTWAAS